MNEEPEETVELQALTEKEAAFVRQYTTHWNGAKAAREAGYETENARHVAFELRTKLHIKAAIEIELEKQRAENALTKEKLVEKLWSMASADPRELIDLQRVNCRHCWGEGHRYQYTPHEMAVRRADHEKKNRGSLPGDDDGFDYGGGVGFRKGREPNPECPECDGLGNDLIVAKDMRDLSPQALSILAGVKVTKEGLQVQMHDQMAAIDKLGRHFGMFVDRKVLENPDGSAVNFAPIMFNGVAAKDGEPENGGDDETPAD